MKAIAKKDCYVILTKELDFIPLNKIKVEKGQEIDLPLFEIKQLPQLIEDTFGKFCVIFKDELSYILTYSSSFEYIS